MDRHEVLGFDNLPNMLFQALDTVSAQELYLSAVMVVTSVIDCSSVDVSQSNFV